MTPVRFLYTSQPGKGFEEFISPDWQLKNWLRENLRQPHSPSYTRTLNKGLSVALQDGWVICTYLTRQTDDNNRPFIRNHSVLVPEAEYNGLAKDFDRTILAHIEEGDESVLKDGNLKPLGVPEAARNGLQREDLEAVANYFGPDLERLLASLISGKSFSVRIRGVTEEAIGLTTTILKTAALGNLPVPQISTFEPSPKTRNWYPSQILSSSQGRAGIQFQPKSPPDREATSSARRLVRSVANFDPDGIGSSMRTASNHAEVMRHYPATTVNPPAATQTVKSESHRTNGAEAQIYEFNKEYEAALNDRKEQLDARQEKLNNLEEELDARQSDLDYQERTLSDKERLLEEETALVKEKGAKRAHWRHIEKIFDVLESNNYQEPQHLVMSRFFEQLKNLEQDTLQILNTTVEDFLPELQKIAEYDEAGKSTFLRDLENIEKKLERKGSRWGIPWPSSRSS